MLDFKKAGYKVYDNRYKERGEPYIFQKWIYKNSVRQYAITVFVYKVNGQLLYGPDVQFNNGTVFNVELLDYGSTEDIEKFYKNMFDKMECIPYDND